MQNAGNCSDCAVRVTPESASKISVTLSGRTYPNRKSNTKVGKFLPFTRNCPNCKTELQYCSKYSVNRANRTGALCNSCSAYKYNKVWGSVITEEHKKKMRATKAGFSSWKEYVQRYPKKKQYKAEVWKITYQQELTGLPNWDSRGRCGVDGAYQLDHIVSIDAGWKNGISPQDIGHIENLIMLPWKDNLLKSNK